MSLTNLKKALKEKEIVFGSERSIKLIKNGKINEIFLASNCPKNIKDKISYYAKFDNIKIYSLKEPNDELGLICKKPFSISVVSVLK